MKLATFSMPFLMPRRSTKKLMHKKSTVHITVRHGFATKALNILV